MKTLDGFKKGVNLGGWLSQGPLDKEHLDTFITEKDIARIASWGLDHVRLPILKTRTEVIRNTATLTSIHALSGAGSTNSTWFLTCTRHMDIYLTTRLIFLNSSMRNLFRRDSTECGESS